MPGKQQQASSGNKPTLRSASITNYMQPLEPQDNEIEEAEKGDQTVVSNSQLLQTINKQFEKVNDRFDKVHDRFDHVSHCFDEIHSELNEVKASVDSTAAELRAENERLCQTVDDLQVKIKSLESKLDNIEGQSRRNNLVFYGIAEADVAETWDLCEEKIKEIIEANMPDVGELSIERAHRLGAASTDKNRKPRPIIVKFLSYRQKDKILRMRKNLKGSGIGVAEDFTQRVRAVRNKLKGFMNEAVEDGKTAFLSHDKLFIDHSFYKLNDAGTGLVKCSSGVQNKQ